MKMEEPDNRSEELKEAPLLRSMQRATPLQAPDGYFDLLGARIQDQINQRSSRQPSLVLQPWMSGITLTAILTVLYLYIREPLPTPPMAAATDEISISTDDLMTTNYYLEMEEEIIVSALTEPEASRNVSEEHLEKYLLETFNEEELINEL